MNYEKPQMKFVTLHNESDVANTCWGYHGTSTKLFYDTKGTGFVSFQIGGGNCNLTLTQVHYYATKKDYNENVYTTINQGDEKYDELYDALVATGGNKGQPYDGEGKFVFPDDPGKMS